MNYEVHKQNIFFIQNTVAIDVFADIWTLNIGWLVMMDAFQVMESIFVSGEVAWCIQVSSSVIICFRKSYLSHTFQKFEKKCPCTGTCFRMQDDTFVDNLMVHRFWKVKFYSHVMNFVLSFILNQSFNIHNVVLLINIDTLHKMCSAHSYIPSWMHYIKQIPTFCSLCTFTICYKKFTMSFCLKFALASKKYHYTLNCYVCWLFYGSHFLCCVVTYVYAQY